jgi:hypothetical protein
MRGQLGARVLRAIVLLLCVNACSRVNEQHQQAQPPGSGTGALEAYPPGRWRLVETRELERTVIWVSHILIRHVGSDARVMGTVFDWRLDAPPQRSSLEARALINELATKIREQPERFEEIARAYSEDPTTAANGGSLGGTRASDFRYEPEVLDALVALRPGEISRIVETRHGFQIFRRRPPPEPAAVSGVHIVLGHSSAPWLGLLGFPVPTRTHAEALALAGRLQEEAMTDPASFAELVKSHSEHPDKVAGGDIGEWSVREATHYPRIVEALSRLAIGGISQPIETHCGVEIVMRTAHRARPLYAMKAVTLAYEPNDPESLRETSALAQSLIEKAAANPPAFDQFRREYCCTQAERWFEGRDAPGLTPVVARLSIGEMASAPIEQFGAMVIPKRIDPNEVPPPPEALLEVPAPERPKLDWAVRILPMELVAQQIAAIAAEEPGLAPTEHARILLQELIHSADTSATTGAGQSTRERFLSNVQALFSAAGAEQYAALLEERAGRLLMGANSVNVN